jgi:hypothetical protein
MEGNRAEQNKRKRRGRAKHGPLRAQQRRKRQGRTNHGPLRAQHRGAGRGRDERSSKRRKALSITLIYFYNIDHPRRGVWGRNCRPSLSVLLFCTIFLHTPPMIFVYKCITHPFPADAPRKREFHCGYHHTQQTTFNNAKILVS